MTQSKKKSEVKKAEVKKTEVKKPEVKKPEVEKAVNTMFFDEEKQIDIISVHREC